MVDQYKAEDDKQRERIQSKNGLESYAYKAKQTVEDENVKDKITEEEKKTVLNKVTETLGWLETNQTAENDEFDHHQKELEKVCQPAMMKLYQHKVVKVAFPGGMPGMSGRPEGVPSTTPGGGTRGTTIDEVD